MIKATIFRGDSTPEGTFGELVMEGLQCYTAELPWKENKPKVSCIPEGVYVAQWFKSPKHGWCYQLDNVPHRRSIQIHSANFAGDEEAGYACELLGCIALGLKKGPILTPQGNRQMAVISSRLAIEAFHKLTQGQPVELTIKKGGV